MTYSTSSSTSFSYVYFMMIRSIDYLDLETDG